ncbi:hypothetical protein KEM52_000730 [Ascosphaera acerosa]|nr:hypothetical protein KEM52_000730 [Ascosphaera acerosa]
MGLWVLDDKHLSHVPGTADILQQQEQRHQVHAHLKYDTSGPEPILLVPQPSDDPNDPLLWSKWKKDGILLLLCVTAVLVTTVGPILAATTLEMVINFQISIPDAALLTGWVLCGCGVAGILIVPTARVWGKRHLYILGCLVSMASCIWAGRSGHNHKSMLWARIIQGVGLAPYESLVGASVGDMYYVHERGLRMAITSVSLFGGAFMTPVIAGKMAYDMGWRWNFYFIAIFVGVAAILVFLFVPETAYRRDSRLELDLNGNLSQETVICQDSDVERAAAAREDDPEKDAVKSSTRPVSPSGSPATVSVPQPLPKKKTYWQQLALFDGRKTDDSFWKMVLRPFPLFFQPGLTWACLIQGVTIGWTVFIGVIFGIMFNGPPLFYTEVKVGYMYSGAFIGSLGGLVVAAITADPLSTWMARRNNGIYEPEFRIILVIPQLIFAAIGLFGLGYSTADPIKYGSVPSCVFFGFVTASMVVGAVASTSYVVDAHRNMAVEGLTCLLVFKNMFSFALTYKAMDWIVMRGSKDVFFYLGAVQMGICVLSIPMYIFGKRNRSFWHRHDLLKILHLW